MSSHKHYHHSVAEQDFLDHLEKEYGDKIKEPFTTNCLFKDCNSPAYVPNVLCFTHTIAWAESDQINEAITKPDEFSRLWEEFLRFRDL